MSQTTAKVKIEDVIIDFHNAKAFSSEKSVAHSVDLDDRSLYLLELLLSKEDKKANREELLSAIWKGKVVSDDSLTNLVSQTRSKIKQVSSFNIIRTLPKKGYALQGKISSFRSNDNNLQSETSSAPSYKWPVLLAFLFLAIALFSSLKLFNSSHSNETLAVLPIDAFSNDPSIINASMSLTEELTHQLTNYPTINVVSRTVSANIERDNLKPDQISEALNSRYFIEGSIRESDESVRLTIQLIDGTSGLHVFSSVVDSSIEGFLTKREEIIQRLSRLVIYEVPFKTLDVSEIEQQVFIDRCDSYLDIAYLYARYLLINIEAFASTAEPACVALSQIAEKPVLLSKPAELYLFMAQASVKDRSQRLGYINMGRNYVDQGLEKLPDNEDLIDVSFKLWNYQLLDALNYKTDPTVAFEQLSLIGEKARSLFPENSDFINNYAVALRRYGVALARRGDSPVEYFEKGIMLLKKGIELEPNNSNMVHNLGRIYGSYSSYLSSTGEDHIPMLKKGIAQYKQAIEMKPDYYDAYVNIGIAFLGYTKWLANNQKPYQEALANTRHYYGKAILLTEKKQQIHNNLSSLNAELSRIELMRGRPADDSINEGIEEANKALSSQPDYIWPHFNLMDLYYYKHMQEFAENGNSLVAGQDCLRFAEKGHKLKDNLASTWHTKTKCAHLTVRMHLQANRFDAAARLLDEIEVWINHSIKLNSKMHMGYQLLGTNELLKLRADRGNTDNIDAVILPFRHALELRQYDEELNIAVLEALTFFRSSQHSQFTQLASQVITVLQTEGYGKVASQLLQQLYANQKLNQTIWMEEIEKKKLKYGLMASYYGRQYKYLLN